MIRATLRGAAPSSESQGLFGGEILPLSLVSLRKMVVLFQLHRFADVLNGFDQVAFRAGQFLDHKIGNEDAIKREILGSLMEMEQLCRVIELKSTGHQVENLINATRSRFDLNQLRTMLLNFQLTLFNELEEHLFLYIPQSESPLYLDVQFNEDTKARLPKNLNKDMWCAGRCFAIANYNGCVLHLMRVVDFGFEKLAKKFKAPFDKHWQVIINKIRGEINNIDAKHPRLKKDKAFYAEVLDHIEVFKDAYRNNAMHRKVYYGREDAIKIFNSVKLFMEHLSKKLFSKPRKGT